MKTFNIFAVALLAGVACAAAEEETAMEEETKDHTPSHSMCQLMCRPSIGKCVETMGTFVCIPRVPGTSFMKAAGSWFPRRRGLWMAPRPWTRFGRWGRRGMWRRAPWALWKEDNEQEVEEEQEEEVEREEDEEERSMVYGTSYGKYSSAPYTTTTYGKYASAPYTSYGKYASAPYTSYGKHSTFSYGRRSAFPYGSYGSGLSYGSSWPLTRTHMRSWPVFRRSYGTYASY